MNTDGHRLVSASGLLWSGMVKNIPGIIIKIIYCGVRKRTESGDPKYGLFYEGTFVSS